MFYQIPLYARLTIGGFVVAGVAAIAVSVVTAGMMLGLI